MTYCNDFITKQCARGDTCKFDHELDICQHFWKFNKCKFNDTCRYKHINNPRPKKYKKNTETFKPMNKNDVDMRILINDASQTEYFNETLTSKDVIIINNLFNDHTQNTIYEQLVNEMENCGIPQDELFKLWHGDSHLIADDKLDWKLNCPTFNMVIDRLQNYFNMDVQTTRFNWYRNSEQFKPFHFDSSSINKDKAAVQNFTLAVSFGTTREIAFERDTRDKIKISIPQKDGQCYAFNTDTNILWRHGILQENEIKDEGRISIILWGWVNY
jgi:hypothetical protein